MFPVRKNGDDYLDDICHEWRAIGEWSIAVYRTFYPLFDVKMYKGNKGLTAMYVSTTAPYGNTCIYLVKLLLSSCVTSYFVEQ